MSLDTITGGMRALLNNDEITSYERTVLNSMLDQATRRGRLSEKQVKFYESIASNYTENALADKREWEATFVDKKLEDLRIVARYYKKQGTYFLALAEKILSDNPEITINDLLLKVETAARKKLALKKVVQDKSSKKKPAFAKGSSKGGKVNKKSKPQLSELDQQISDMLEFA